MKKIILLVGCLTVALSVSAGEPYMDKALSSWVGYPIEAIIKHWGYPDNQQTIAGKNIYIWEDRTTSQEDTYQRSYVKTDKKGRTYVDSYTSGGGTYDYYCRKIIEVDSNNKISGYSYKGNSCPNAYFLAAKKLVNPDNNQWEKRKLEKKGIY